MKRKTAIGKHLRTLRHQRGLSLIEVSRRMGNTNHTQAYRIENGVDPRMSSVVRYCEAIGARIHIGLVEAAHADTTSKENLT